MSFSLFEFSIPLLIIGIIVLTSFLYFSYLSLKEKEPRAANILFLTSFIFSLPFITSALIQFDFRNEVSWILLALTLLALLIFITPIKFRKKQTPEIPQSKVDERNIMFSRRLLKEGDGRFEEYYKKFPDRKLLDDEFRNKPGLLQPGTSYYHKEMFTSADATFSTVDALKFKVEGEINPEKKSYDLEKITTYIKEWTKYLGTLDCGVTELEEYHKYLVTGRNFNYGEEVVLNHKYAIAFTVEMDYEMVKAAPAGPIVMESSKQYLMSGAIAVQLAEFIRQLGYPARAHIDGNYQVICPLIARDAGLGEIGRMGLLMTPNHGPRVRIAAVTTDLPLQIDKRNRDDSVIEFCKDCLKCADTCPSQAIPFDEQKEIDGAVRWQINSEACFTFWYTSGTDCGRCVSVCPYSHEDNLLHNIVRKAIRRSDIVRKAAVPLDDLLYGRKPTPLQPPHWTEVDA